jgi:Tfp pilus assembly protein PilZ
MERLGQGCRRRFPRFPAAGTVETGEGNGTLPRTSRATDLGCGGVRISAPALFPEGRQLLVRFRTPGGALAREAEVAWAGVEVGGAANSTGWPHGLRFLAPLPAATVLALAHVPAPGRATPEVPERTVPLDAVSLPDIPIARGGLFVRCPDPFPLGSLVHLRLLPPEGPALHLAGRVVWANAGGHNPFPPGMGVQVIECPPEEAARLKALLERQAVPGRPAMAAAWYALRPGQAAHALPSRRCVL